MAQLPPNYSPPAGMDPPIPGPYPPCTNDPHSAQLTQVDDPNQIVDGWPKLARLISDNPGFEAFPSFKDLNIKMLLYYQAELHLLKEKLRKRECDDCIESERRQNNFCSANVYNNRFEHLLSLKELDKNNPDREQYNLVMEMRLLLEKYNNALIQYSQITALPKAEPLNVTALRKWIKGHPDPYKIFGAESKIWGDIDPLKGEQEDDLTIGLLLKQSLDCIFRLFWPKKDKREELDLIVPRCDDQEGDRFARWVATQLVPFIANWRKWWKKPKKMFPDHEKGICAGLWSRNALQKPPSSGKKATVQPATLDTYSKNRMVRATSMGTIIIASALPVVAITALSKINGTDKLLGTIAAFTVAFTCGLLLFGGGARKVDVFTATAAFSAVMVVFVQNQNQGGGSCQPCVGSQA